MPYQYGYLIGCLIIFIVWLALYFWRKDLRREMLFSGLTAAPFGLSQFMYVPEYWNPPTLFNLLQKYGFDLESIIFCFLVGGLAAVFYEVIFRQKTVKIFFNRKSHLLAYVITIVLYLGLELIFTDKTIYNGIFAMLAGAAFIGIQRKDLIKQIIFNGFFFGLLYFVLFFFFLQIFPQYVTSIYNLKNFIGLSIFGVPAEEIIFAFSLGACWSTFFEYIKGYRTKPLK